MTPSLVFLAQVLSTTAQATVWNIPDDGSLGEVVYYVNHGDVIEVEPGCCDGYYAPIPQISKRITIRSSLGDGTRVKISDLQITALPEGDDGVVLQDLEIKAAYSNCSDSALCVLDLNPGVLVDLVNVKLTTSPDTGIIAPGTAASPITLRFDGFEAGGTAPLITGTYVNVEMKDGTLDGVQAASLSYGSIIMEDMVHLGADGNDVGGLVEGSKLSALEVRGLESSDSRSSDQGGLIWAKDSPLVLEDAQVTGCATSAGGGLLFLEGTSTQPATLRNLTVTGCSSDVTGPALVQATGYDLSIEGLWASDLVSGDDTAIMDVREGSLEWSQGEVCGVQANSGYAITSTGGALTLQNLLLRRLSGVSTLLQRDDGDEAATLAQLTLDLEDGGLSKLFLAGEVELFNSQLVLDGASLGTAELVGRSGFNHAIGDTWPAGYSALEGDLLDSDAGWEDTYLRTACELPGLPKLQEDHPAWDGGYTDDEWQDPDCSDSDVGVFGGPHVDLDLATWFDASDCEGGADSTGGGDGNADGLGGDLDDVSFGGGLQACGCGGAGAASFLLFPLGFLIRRRR